MATQWEGGGVRVVPGGGDYGTNLRGKAKKKEENLAKRASCRLNFKMNNFASEWMNEPASE